MHQHQMRVFLSHSSADAPFANALVVTLRRAGADVWIDDSHLGAGQLLEEITRELSARPVFVVVLSQAAFASEWVRRECTWAFNLYSRQQNRLILPVVAKPLDPDAFNAMLFLEDFRRVEGPQHTPYPPDEAIAQTLRLLQLTLPTTAPIPTLAPAPTLPTAPPVESVLDLLTQGKALSAQARYAEALPLVERATQLAPESDEVWLNYGMILDELGRTEEAETAFGRWMETEPSIAETWLLRGEFLWSDSQFEEALAYFDRALELEPANISALLEKVAALLVLGRQVNAKAFLADLTPAVRAAVRDAIHQPEEQALMEIPAEIRAILTSAEVQTALKKA
jgi:DNA-directed RNA polymerase subunit F